MQSQVRFNRFFREGCGERLGGFGAEPRQVQRVPEKVPEKVPEEVPEKVPEKGPGSGQGSGEGFGSLCC